MKNIELIAVLILFFPVTINSSSEISEPKKIINEFSLWTDAILENKNEVIEELISKKINVNVQGEIGYTPLHVASLRNNDTAVKLLLAAGANQNIVCKHGHTASQLAEICSCWKSNRVFKNLAKKDIK